MRPNRATEEHVLLDAVLVTVALVWLATTLALVGG